MRINSLILAFLVLFYNSYSSKVIDDYNVDANFFCENNSCKEEKNNSYQSSRLSVKRYNKSIYKVESNDSLSKIKEDKTQEKDSKISSFFSMDFLKALKNDFFYNYNLSGIYFTGGLTMPTMYGLSGDRHRAGYDTNAGFYPIHSQNLSFYLGLGYNKTLPYNLLIGIEGFYTEPRVSSLSKWYINYININGNIINSGVGMNTNTSLKRTFGVKIRAGFHIWRCLFYGIIGYSYNMIGDSNYSVNVAGFSDSKSIGAHGLIYGGGFEFYLTNSFFIRLEYFENLFAYKMKFNNIYEVNSSGLVTGNNLELSNSMRIGTLLFSAGFKFTI